VKRLSITSLLDKIKDVVINIKKVLYKSLFDASFAIYLRLMVEGFPTFFIFVHLAFRFRCLLLFK
jgi:hypothetical protein